MQKHERDSKALLSKTIYGNDAGSMLNASAAMQHASATHGATALL